LTWTKLPYPHEKERGDSDDGKPQQATECEAIGWFQRSTGFLQVDLLGEGEHVT